MAQFIVAAIGFLESSGLRQELEQKALDFARRVFQGPPIIDENDPYAVIAPWYREMLRDNGYEDLAKKVDSLAEGEQDARSAAKILDNIREQVDDERVKSHLLLYDCTLQAN